MSQTLPQINRMLLTDEDKLLLLKAALATERVDLLIKHGFFTLVNEYTDDRGDFDGLLEERPLLGCILYVIESHLPKSDTEKESGNVDEIIRLFSQEEEFEIETIGVHSCVDIQWSINDIPQIYQITASSPNGGMYIDINGFPLRIDKDYGAENLLKSFHLIHDILKEMNSWLIEEFQVKYIAWSKRMELFDNILREKHLQALDNADITEITDMAIPHVERASLSSEQFFIKIDLFDSEICLPLDCAEKSVELIDRLLIESVTERRRTRDEHC